MSETAMREAFIGKTLDGHYADGLAWTEVYLDDGRLDYRDPLRQAVGTWYFRDGTVFCTFYDPPDRPSMAGGCWTTLRIGANCFEFYLVGLTDKRAGDDGLPDMAPRWNARGWRKDEPSTCNEKPSV
jgi:hypothetical protein